jgi:hypothetical protein
MWGVSGDVWAGPPRYLNLGKALDRALRWAVHNSFLFELEAKWTVCTLNGLSGQGSVHRQLIDNNGVPGQMDDMDYKRGYKPLLTSYYILMPIQIP